MIVKRCFLLKKLWNILINVVKGKLNVFKDVGLLLKEEKWIIILKIFARIVLLIVNLKNLVVWISLKKEK